MRDRIIEHAARRRRLVLCGVVFSVLATLPATAFAQTTGAPAPQGLTVIGSGQASAKADSAHLQLLIGDPSGMIDQAMVVGPESQMATPESTPEIDRRAQLEPIVEAIKEQGIKQEAIAVVLSPVENTFAGGPAGVPVGRIDLTVSRPTLAKLAKIFDAVRQAAAREQLALGQIGTAYTVKDCQALNQEARKAAIEDARTNAKTQADLLGIQIGPVTASADLAAGYPLAPLYGLPVFGGCTQPAQPTNFGDLGLQVSLPTFDPATEPAVTVYAQVSLTFAIAAG